MSKSHTERLPYS